MAVVRLLRRGGGLRAVLPWTGAQLTATAAGATTPSLAVIFLTFLKLGAVAFGSGYVLLVLLRSEFVLSLHWLTERQVVDAIAVSQATPGPVFTAATFIGYLLAGLAGAVLATSRSSFQASRSSRSSTRCSRWCGVIPCSPTRSPVSTSRRSD